MARPRAAETSLVPSSLQNNKHVYIARQNEPKVKGKLGRPSAWLDTAQKKIWKTLVKNSPAVMGESDRTLLEITVVLKSKLESATIENAQLTQLISCLTKLGFIPKDRVASEPLVKPVDEWSELDEA
jgi:hypothetical protein